MTEGLNPAGGNAEAATEEKKNDYVILSTQPEVKAEASKDDKSKEASPTKKDDAEDSAADTDTGEGKKKRTGYQRKLDAKDEEISRLNAQIAARGNAGDKAPEKAADAPIEGLEPEPDENSPKYKDKTWKEFSKDLMAWEIKRDKLIAANESKQVEAKKDHETKVNSYKERVTEAQKIHDDFDDVLHDYEGPQSPELHRAILDSDNGAEVAYYLATNLEEAEKMRGMNKDQLNRFIGKIEAKLELGTVKETPVVKTTKAPPPIKPVGKGSASESVDFPENGTFEEKKAWEKRQKK